MSEGQLATAGNKGSAVRSDCWISIKIETSGGIDIQMKSKVESLYGESNINLIRAMMSFYEIENAVITIEDSGALPFVIMARIEAVIRKLGLDQNKRYLPDWENTPPESSRDRFRRSRLYLPGDQPKFFINAGIHKPDGLILDLEDSVAPVAKESARILVRNALRCIDFKGAERMVRINQLPLGFADLDEIIPQSVDVILIPKAETPEQIQQIDAHVSESLKKHSLKRDVYFMPILESALGIINAYQIAKVSDRIIGLAIGLEDYTADMGTQRTKEGTESLFARMTLVNAAKAAGIQAIDTVFSDVADMEGLVASVREAKALGFDGKGCIHPRQIAPIHHAFAPSAEEIDKAKRIVIAFEEAEAKGLSVVALGSKMIDPPVVKRAFRTINLAIKSNLLSVDWRTANDKT